MPIHAEDHVTTAAASTVADSIRVMVVDDSAVIRTLSTRIVEENSQVSVVATAGNGQIALDSLSANDIDVVILDIEMPVMDGMTALPLLLKKKPGIQILVASTLTAKNAAISLKALSMGATDYLTKPQAAGLRDAAESDPAAFTEKWSNRERRAKVVAPELRAALNTALKQVK